jgi:concanavalin A-like lectin/glucanase superfamily protein
MMTAMRTWVLILAAMPAAVVTAQDTQYSWQRPHARVLPTGSLQWAPQLFAFAKGDSVRYIDFAGGDDRNAGDAKDKPWKHHPWDANATGKAKECKGIHTYVFKRGVIYRGALTAAESGVPGNPIRLTSDPDWGKGEACLFGSEQFKGGWTRCDAQSAPGIPKPDKVWFRDLATPAGPWALWETRGDRTIRIPIARAPNWTISDPDDPQKEWYVWTGWTRKPRIGRFDPVHLTQKDPHFYDGGAVFTEWSGNMGTVYRREIQQYRPEDHALVAGKGRTGNRYFIENVRGLLDAPGEYFFAAAAPFAGRLYLRMPEDRDPNACVLEASRIKWLVVLRDKSHIVISGLRFSFNDVEDPGSGWPIIPEAPVAVRIAGSCRDVRILNCRFYHVMGAVSAFTRLNKRFGEAYVPDLHPWQHDVMDEIEISDNDIYFCDRQAVMVSGGVMLTKVEWPPRGELKRVRVLRNRLRWVALRPGSHANSDLAAITVDTPEEAEIAGNILDRCAGSGIVTLGSRSGNAPETGDTPLTRILIHHNSVSNTVLSCNDYGGIAPWQGGTNYIYNNIAGNTIGHKNELPTQKNEKTWAYTYYLDGTFKSYVFNNIAWGKRNALDDPYRNRGAFMQVGGFMNHWFNNTAYHYVYGFHGSSGQRNSYLGNLLCDMTDLYCRQHSKGDIGMRFGGETDQAVPWISSLAYGYNVFFGPPNKGFTLGAFKGRAPQDMARALAGLPAKFGEYGAMATKQPLRDPAKFDFRPVAGSGVEGRGVKFFVPWSLYAMVGEWNFHKDLVDPQRILGENFYMTDEYMHRRMYYEIPRNDLKVPGATLADYVSGPLEDWIDGALQFNGRDRYCVLPDKELKSGYTVSEYIEPEAIASTRKAWLYPAGRRKTVDMNDNNFLIEVYFRTQPDFRDGVLVSKRQGRGYELHVDGAGTLTFAVQADGKAGVTTTKPLNDGKWRHVIAEADRKAGVLRVYVDGKLDAEAKADLKGSCSNTGDFLVGKGHDGRFFAGAMDFLRVARGTLADARTTIEELHTWQFDGPFLRDIRGTKAHGKRNAGALLLPRD